MIAQKPRLGPKSKITQKAWTDLAQQIRAGKIHTAKDAKQYLEDQHQIVYRTIGAVWWMLYKKGAKLKPKTNHDQKMSHKRIWSLDSQDDKL